MVNLKLRRAEVHDSRIVSYCVRAMLKDMESIGGHQVNSDETFWAGIDQTVMDAIRNKNNLYMFAEVEDNLAGFIEGRIQKPGDVFAPKEIFHITSVYVVPKYRRQGIATAILKEALNWASTQGCDEAELNVLINNYAKGLYEKAGFTVSRQEMRMQIKT